MTTTTISERDKKTLALIERLRQEAIRDCGIDVRTLKAGDGWGKPVSVKKALGLELNRRRFVEMGKIPADA